MEPSVEGSLTAWSQRAGTAGTSKNGTTIATIYQAQSSSKSPPTPGLEALEIDDDEEHKEGGEKVGDIGGCLTVEGLQRIALAR